MEEALSFFRTLEVWIYLLLGLGGIYFTRKFILAWQELQEASFGLERETAQSRLNQSASILVILLTMAVIEFVLVSFIAPSVPGAAPLPTTTLNPLATPTSTLSPQETITPSDDALTPVVPTQASAFPEESACVPESIEITSPSDGSEVSGFVQVAGSANIPNFGFYKLEIKRPEETMWATIQAGNQVVESGELGNWDTRRLTPGVYQLGLTVQDNATVSPPHCVVQVRVLPEETTE